MPIAPPVTDTVISTTAWGIPMTNEVNALRTELATAQAEIDVLQAHDTDLDAAWIIYTPTTTNVGGTFTAVGAYKLIGAKTLAFRMALNGTPTAAGAGQIVLSLPAGMVGTAAQVQAVHGIKGAGVCAAYVFTSGVGVVIHADANGTNFTAGQTAANTRANGVINLT